MDFLLLALHDHLVALAFGLDAPIATDLLHFLLGLRSHLIGVELGAHFFVDSEDLGSAAKVLEVGLLPSFALSVRLEALHLVLGLLHLLEEEAGVHPLAGLHLIVVLSSSQVDGAPHRIVLLHAEAGCLTGLLDD